MNVTFDSKTAVPLVTAREEINFPIMRENLISEDSSVGAGKDSIIREDTMAALGIISKRRGLLPYGTVMDWLTDEFERTGTEFKLIESVINNRGDFFQQYLFNTEIDNPDGEVISPMVIAKASYVKKPLELLFGTYRFVCSNGAIVGTTFESIDISGREINDLTSYSLRDDISRNLDNMNRISAKYQELANSPMDEYMNTFLTEDFVPVGMKKNALEKLSSEGVINFALDDEGEEIKLKKEHFKDGQLGALFTMNAQKSAWAFYNDLTEISTHRTRSIKAKYKTSDIVSRVFNI